MKRIKQTGYWLPYPSSAAGAAVAPAAIAGLPAARGLRAGTTVEIACLYTIWLTAFFNSTTYWSKDSI